MLSPCKDCPDRALHCHSRCRLSVNRSLLINRHYAACQLTLQLFYSCR